MSDPINRLNAALEGRYRVDRQVGEGGMATVYLADDLKHERKVAFKVLKPDLAAVVGAERFLAEIKTTANLQHPHILPLFDSGEADSFLFYVMPYLEGESLRQRLDREHQLPVDDAVHIATDVAAALDYAHRQGIIHRDIKPANVLMLDGRPVISDFGIALAVGAAGGNRLTETGLSVGTPHYMSPEQATGDETVGPSTDIFALGCVLHEMLVGEPPFTGSTAQAILGKIITGDPESVGGQRKSVPTNVDAAIMKTLQKLPADRFASMAQFAEALNDPAFALTTAGQAIGTPSTTIWWRRLAVSFAALATVFLLSTVWALTRPEAPKPVSRYGIAVPGSDAGLLGLALSRDGSQLVYWARGDSGADLWLRRLDQLHATRLPLYDIYPRHPFFSPDGQRLAFFEYVQAGATGTMTLKMVSLDGGSPITLADSGLGAGGAYGVSGSWGDDGFIYASGITGGLLRIPEGGGVPRAFTALDTTRGESLHMYPDVLPDGNGVLFTIVVHVGDEHERAIAVADTRTGTHSVLGPGRQARYAASGHLVYTTDDGELMAAPFDLSSFTITGDAVVLASDDAAPILPDPFDISRTGTLTYATESKRASNHELVWVTPNGTVEPVDPGWTEEMFWGWSLSPDGTKLAVGKNDGQVWIKQLDRGPLSRLTFEGGSWPTWTSDGQSVVFRSDVDLNLYVKRVDGSGVAVLLRDDEAEIMSGSLSGNWLSYGTFGGMHYAIDFEADSVPVELGGLLKDSRDLRLSPDRRWLAYTSRALGQSNVFVQPFPDVDAGRWQITTGEAASPAWGNSGRELFYIEEDSVFAVEVLSGPTFVLGKTRALFARQGLFNLAVSPDDQRFMMERSIPDETSSQLIVVTSFFEELKRRVPN